MVTIHKSQKKQHVEQDDLQAVIDILQYGYVNVIHWQTEFHGMYSQLHAHALVSTVGTFRYLGCTQINGFQLHWTKVKSIDITTIIQYIDKNTQNACAAINHCKKHYIPHT